MVELKIFHDRAKKQKEKLTTEFNKNKESLKKSKLKNIVTLINNFDKRVSSSFSSIKKLNQRKIEHEKKIEVLEEKIIKLEPKISKRINNLQIDLFAFLEWERKQENICRININKKVFAGTIFKGVYSTLEAKNNLNKCLVFEKQNSNSNFQLVIENK